MSVEKMREGFEEEYMIDICERTASAPDPGWLERGSDGEYRSYRAQGAWWGWQASREALVIELPSADGLSPQSAEYGAIWDCREAIEAAGAKCK